MKIQFTIPGQPVPRLTPKISRDKSGFTRMYQSSKVTNWEKFVGYHCIKYKPPEPFDGPISLRLNFYLEKPKTAPNKRKYADRQPDIDNLCKSCIDPMQGIIFTNDSRIVHLTASKNYGDPRVEITIMTLGE